MPCTAGAAKVDAAALMEEDEEEEGSEEEDGSDDDEGASGEGAHDLGAVCCCHAQPRCNALLLFQVSSARGSASAPMRLMQARFSLYVTPASHQHACADAMEDSDDEYGAPAKKQKGTAAAGSSGPQGILYGEAGQFNPHAARQVSCSGLRPRAWRTVES